jgi:PmbA protein
MDATDPTAALRAAAEQSLALMRAAGFDQAQAGASLLLRDELNIQHNEPSLLRSTATQKLALTGLVDGRKASTELADFEDAELLQRRIAALHADAVAAPQDDANAISAGQRANIVQGPPDSDLRLLADTVAELLAFRARETPKMMLEEGLAAHSRRHGCVLTSGGSDLACRIGWYEASAFGTAREGKQASSFNHAGGSTHDLRATHVADTFGIGDMLRETERQIHAHPVGAKFTGDVVLTPNAVADLVFWLLGQLADVQLIAGTSLYRSRVGQPIAAPALSVRSRFDAPGVVAVSADAFATPPIQLVKGGVLQTLTPSLYGSRKTGLPHVPVAGDGWEVGAGDVPRADLLAGVRHGAVVGRLSMGSPASNGDFSGVIKNSFAIEGGATTGALAETMITGNVAQMLRDITGVSRERLDMGSLCLPWIRIGGLHFS